MEFTEPTPSPTQPKGRWVFIPDPTPEEFDAVLTNTVINDADFTTPTTFLQPAQATPALTAGYSNSPDSFVSSHHSSPYSSMDFHLPCEDLDGPPLFPELDLSSDEFNIVNLNMCSDSLTFDSLGSYGILPIEDAALLAPIAPLNGQVEDGIFYSTSYSSPSDSAFNSMSPSIPSLSPQRTPALPRQSTPVFFAPPSAALRHLPIQPLSPPPSRPVQTPYRCSTCDKAYSKRCDLTKHERKHVKPHRCEYCKFGSAELRGLQRHMWATHREVAESMEVPKQIAKCGHPGCTYEGRLDNLKRHMKRHEKHKAKRAAALHR